jgi:putative transposase
MSEYRRSKVAGGFYFFTVVTYHWLPIFTNEISRGILYHAWKNTKQRFPFETIAVYLFPDHLHCIWQFPEGDTNYSVRWKEIKRLFTKGYLKEIGPGEERNNSRIKRSEAAIWQRRF